MTSCKRRPAISGLIPGPRSSTQKSTHSPPAPSEKATTRTSTSAVRPAQARRAFATKFENHAQKASVGRTTGGRPGSIRSSMPSAGWRKDPTVKLASFAGSCVLRPQRCRQGSEARLAREPVPSFRELAARPCTPRWLQLRVDTDRPQIPQFAGRSRARARARLAALFLLQECLSPQSCVSRQARSKTTVEIIGPVAAEERALNGQRLCFEMG